MNYTVINQLDRLSGQAFGILLLALLFWFVTLVLALRNRRLSDVSRFMWVFLSVMLPVLGGLLYLFMAPSSAGPSEQAQLSEEEIHRRIHGIPEKTKWENR